MCQLGHRDLLRISIHALRGEGDNAACTAALWPANFYPRPPRGGRLPDTFSEFLHRNFYPRPPRGGRHPYSSWERGSNEFLSTPSAGRATCQLGRIVDSAVISIHALREEGDDEQFVLLLSHGISIHALREEGDSNFLLSENSADDISIHALREEGDLNCPLPSAGNKRFLSTPSARRATSAGHICTFTARFLSTPSARRATLQRQSRFFQRVISIHALREEGDSKNGEKHLRFCFIIKRSAQIWKSLSKNIQKNSCDLHRTA